MRTKEEVRQFLNNLQWQRMSKKDLEKTVQAFFDSKNKLFNFTCEDCKDIDYSFGFTTGDENSTSHFIDIEIWYLKMRNREILITGSEILSYEE